MPSMAVEDIRITMGGILREFREQQGWSQEELGHRSGLHRNYIGGIERGERNVALINIAKLSKALGIRPRDLLP